MKGTVTTVTTVFRKKIEISMKLYCTLQHEESGVKQVSTSSVDEPLKFCYMFSTQQVAHVTLENTVCVTLICSSLLALGRSL